MAGEDLLRPVELFEQHRADQEVRPGHRAEGQNRFRLIEDRLAEPLGATDGKRDGPGAVIAPGSEAVGEVAARPLLPPRIERDEAGAGRSGAARINSASRTFS